MDSDHGESATPVSTPRQWVVRRLDDGSLYTRPRSPCLWMRYMVDGKEQRESTGQTSLKAAEKILRARLDQVAADRLGARPFVGAIEHRVKVGELLDALETDYRLRRVRSLRQVLAHLKPIRQRFSHVKAVTITPAVVDRYIEERLAPRQAADRVFSGKAPATVNRETQLLGQALRLGVARRLLSSAPELRKLSEAGNVRQGFLAPADFEAVVAQLPEDLRDFARFGYASAWRRGELASLLWSDVDLADRVVRLRAEESKNGQTRLLPLEGQLLEIIQRREAARVITVDGQTRLVPYVFHRGGRPVVDFRKAWKRACRAAGVAGQLFHDLRRSGVRNLIRAGVDPSVAMTLSGHKTRAMLDRYNIIDERDLRAAILRTDSYVKAQPVERGVLPLRTGTGGGAR